VSRWVSDRARDLAAELALRFAQDAQLATQLNDAHQRLRRANDRLSWGAHPDVIVAVYDEDPAAVEVVFGENRSEVLGALDTLQALQRVHWQIHRAHCDYQHVAEDRRRLAAEIGEVIHAFVDELVAAGWSEQEARDANIHGLAGSKRTCSDGGPSNLVPFRRNSRTSQFYAPRPVSPPEPGGCGR
jgi:hypothetical protein